MYLVRVLRFAIPLPALMDCLCSLVFRLNSFEFVWICNYMWCIMHCIPINLTISWLLMQSNLLRFSNVKFLVILWIVRNWYEWTHLWHSTTSFVELWCGQYQCAMYASIFVWRANEIDLYLDLYATIPYV